jgi:predicted phage replisome organizer
MAEQSKFYWLKLKRDFFKRHDIQIIEGMPNGKDYVLFYLKLMCESIDHNGNLRFSDTIPYNEQMLATITNTNIDIVRSALTIFQELKMIDILDDRTIFMAEIEKLIGSAADNSNANRQRRFRERQRQQALSVRYESVTENNESKSIEKEIELDIDIEQDNTTTTNNTYPSIMRGAFSNKKVSDFANYDEYLESDEFKFYRLVSGLFAEFENYVALMTAPDDFIVYNKARGWLGIGGELIVKDEDTLRRYVEKWATTEIAKKGISYDT